jgi:hypothetical protein
VATIRTARAETGARIWVLAFILTSVGEFGGKRLPMEVSVPGGLPPRAVA